jgi:RND superfamily putative drug exporter
MATVLSPEGMAKLSARHPWRVLGIWLVAIVVAVMLIGNLIDDALTNEIRVTNNPDSTVGQTLVEDRLRGETRANEAIVIASDQFTVDDPAFQSKVEGVVGSIGALGPEAIQAVTSYYETGDENLVSADRQSTIVPVTMAGNRFDDAGDNIEDVINIVEEAGQADGFTGLISGFATVNQDFNETAEKDLQRSESAALLPALIILVLVFSAIMAAFVPIVLAIFAIIAAIAITAVFGQAFEFSFFVQNMITMMGLAVGIDYSLFYISRYREERARGLEIEDALGVAGGTAGRAVFFSGMTVVIALLGLLLIPHTIFRSLSAGAIFVVLASVAASLTMLPAVLRLLGNKLNLGYIPFIRRAQEASHEQARGGFWDRMARGVMARPIVAAIAAVSLLVLAAIPYFGINLGQSGVSSMPESFTSKQGFEALQADFGGGPVSPVEVVIDGAANSPEVLAAVEDLRTTVANEPALGNATYETNEAGDLGVLAFQLRADPFEDEAVQTVERLREQYIPAAFSNADAEVYVTGDAAISLDQLNLTKEYTPYLFAFVLGLSFILLMIVFRSIVVPTTAILMNLLSVGAAYGLIVLVFQEGVSFGIFQQVEAIESWLPLFLFAVLFGLSMDYHVFLLSRIRERYDQTGDNTEAVAFGLRSTGRLITGAALIMVVVFGAFAAGNLVMMQQMGFGLGVAVLLDATIIRSVLVPATMKLLGDHNWYLPPVLNWLPRIGIEGQAVPAYEPEGAGGSGS